MLFALLAPAAHASGSQRLIFQDNAAMLGSPDATAQELRGLGVDIVKIQVLWSDVAPGGRHKPAGFDAANAPRVLPTPGSTTTRCTVPSGNRRQ